MKKRLLVSAIALFLLSSCNKNKEIVDTLNTYNISMEPKGYHYGDKIKLPKEVSDNVESVTISFGEKETTSLEITPEYYSLGDNIVTFNLKMKNGETLYQDATINVFAKTPEKTLTYEVITEYPHDPKLFVQGFQLDGDIIYESDGQYGASQILKYKLGSTTPIATTPQPNDVFSEGATIIGDKVYQLTWKNKKGYIYNKSTLALESEFPYPNVIGEGWGLTYDGTNLIVSDGSKIIYFLDAKDPSKVVKSISVAGNSQVYDQLNELEFHKGHIYANVWQKPIIIKIDPKTGEVVGKFDFTDIANKHKTGDATKDLDQVLNGIAFKGDNMLVTGKNWSTIYEVKIP